MLYCDSGSKAELKKKKSDCLEIDTKDIVSVELILARRETKKAENILTTDENL